MFLKQCNIVILTEPAWMPDTATHTPHKEGSPEIILAFLNYNTADECLRALAAVPAATHDINTHTVVIDNGSTDDSIQRLKGFDASLDILALSENKGFAGAFNAFFTRYKAPWYMLLNSDIILPPDSVHAFYNAAKDIPDIGLAAPAFYREDGSAQTSYSPFPSLSGELINRSLFQKLNAPSVSTSEPAEVDSVIGATMLVPHSTLDSVGGMDERFFFFFEETDWCKRIWDHGLKVIHVPTVNVIHLQGKAANQTPFRARIEFHYSRMIYFQKHDGASAARVLRAGMTLRSFISATANGILTLLTLGLWKKPRSRFLFYIKLFFWYCIGCPTSWGLRSSKTHSS